MQMRYLGKLLLFIAILGLPAFLPPSDSALNPLMASSGGVRDFGSDGSDGSSGQDGRNGANGESKTIFADGSEVKLDLSGQDGLEGEDGDDGDDAICGRQPRPDRNVRGADGGDGGRGGDGGDGGNGGALTIYYTNIADLKKIYVRAEGGRGGRSGRSGSGGDGCECRERDWDRQVCSGKPGNPDYSCRTREFYCTDGDRGHSGSDGSDGTEGQLGSLSLIKGTQPLSADEPTITVEISELEDGKFALSKNIWKTQSSATSLLAPLSIISDEYREFVERFETSFELVWNAVQPASNLQGQVTISLQDDKEVKVSFPEEFWVAGTRSQENGVTKFVVSHVLRESEATQLRVADFSGNGSNLNFSLIDAAGKSDLLSTQFSIKYRSTTSAARSGKNPEYKTRYEGNIPAELVTREYERFTLALGKLPIDAKYLAPGIAVEVEVVATRSLADRSKEQKIIWTGQIRR